MTTKSGDGTTIRNRDGVVRWKWSKRRRDPLERGGPTTVAADPPTPLALPVVVVIVTVEALRALLPQREVWL